MCASLRALQRLDHTLFNICSVLLCLTALANGYRFNTVPFDQFISSKRTVDSFRISDRGICSCCSFSNTRDSFFAVRCKHSHADGDHGKNNPLSFRTTAPSSLTDVRWNDSMIESSLDRGVVPHAAVVESLSNSSVAATSSESNTAGIVLDFITTALTPWFLRDREARREKKLRAKQEREQAKQQQLQEKLQKKQEEEERKRQEKQQREDKKLEEKRKKEERRRARGGWFGLFGSSNNKSASNTGSIRVVNEFNALLGGADLNATEEDTAESVKAMLQHDDRMIEEEPDYFEELLLRETPLGILDLDLTEDEQMIADYEAAHEHDHQSSHPSNASSGAKLGESVLQAVTSDGTSRIRSNISSTSRSTSGAVASGVAGYGSSNVSAGNSSSNAPVLDALMTKPQSPPHSMNISSSSSKYGLIPMLRGVHSHWQTGSVLTNHSGGFPSLTEPMPRFTVVPPVPQPSKPAEMAYLDKISKDISSIRTRLTTVEKNVQQNAAAVAKVSRISSSGRVTDAAAYAPKGAGKGFVSALAEYQNTFAISPKNVRRCAVGSFFLFGSFLSITVERRFWLVGGLVGALWASGAVRRNSRGGALARRVGVEVAQQIKDLQEKYNQFMIFYRTGKLAYVSSKTWERFDDEWGLTQRFDALKKVTRDRAAAFNSTFAGTGVGEMWEVLRQTPDQARRMDKKYGITTTITDTASAVVSTSLSAVGGLLGIQKPPPSKKGKGRYSSSSSVRRRDQSDEGLVVRAWNSLFGRGTRSRRTAGYAHVDPWTLPWNSYPKRSPSSGGDRDRLLLMLVLVLLIQSFKEVIIAVIRGKSAATIITGLPPSVMGQPF